ncbi:MAG: hypothetical protein ACRDUY_11550 [Nitriliruptorales bacterium]
MSDMPVEIVPYDPAWPDRFAEEHALLARVLAPWIDGGTLLVHARIDVTPGAGIPASRGTSMPGSPSVRGLIGVDARQPPQFGG